MTLSKEDRRNAIERAAQAIARIENGGTPTIPPTQGFTMNEIGAVYAEHVLPRIERHFKRRMALQYTFHSEVPGVIVLAIVDL